MPSTKAYIKFWIVVGNPSKQHIKDAKALAKKINSISKLLIMKGNTMTTHRCFNYFVNVVYSSD